MRFSLLRKGRDANLCATVKLIFTILLSYPLAGVLKRLPDTEPAKKNIFMIGYGSFLAGPIVGPGGKGKEGTYGEFTDRKTGYRYSTSSAFSPFGPVSGRSLSPQLAHMVSRRSYKAHICHGRLSCF